METVIYCNVLASNLSGGAGGTPDASRLFCRNLATAKSSGRCKLQLHVVIPNVSICVTELRYCDLSVAKACIDLNRYQSSCDLYSGSPAGKILSK